MGKPLTEARVLQLTRCCVECGQVKPLMAFREGDKLPGARAIRCLPCREIHRDRRKKESRDARRALIEAGGVRRCYRCGETKPLFSFNAHHDGKAGTLNECRDCANIRITAWRRANNRTGRYEHLLRKYGLSRDGFDALFQSQDGKCAICASPLTVTLHTCVDHDHNTGRIRGLLCRTCNAGIGHLKDSPVLVSAALAYLVRHNAKGN